MTGCQAGCKYFSDGEIKHHKDCKYYPESLSKMYDEHNQYIISLIDERLEKERIKANEYMFNIMSQFTVEALTELKQEIEKLGVGK